MGLAIHYRGRLRDVAQLEMFQRRIGEFALKNGGRARNWRSQSDTRPGRFVRGVLLDLAPGMETVSLLVAPEGWIVPMGSIEDAEEGRIPEAPWVSVKTQFASHEGHVRLVELLDALKKEFLPGLEVSDEGDYWETRDLDTLRRKLGFLDRAIKTLGRELSQSPLSPEAAEDPEILASHIARVAEQARQKLAK